MPAADILSQIPPGVDPTDYLQAMRQGMIADYATQSALTPPSVQNYGRMASRISPLSGVAKLAEAIIAKRANDQAMGSRADVYAKALQSFQPGGQVIQGQPLQQAQPGDVGTLPQGEQGPTPQVARAPGASLTDMVQGTQPTQRPMNPLNPLGMPTQLAMRMYMSDPAKYAELIAGTPEWRTALAAHGGDSNAAMAALQAKYAKEGTMDIRSSGMAITPRGQVIRNPALPQGVEPTFDRDLHLTGSYMIPGVPQAEQEMARRGELGKEQGKIQILPTKGGGQSVLLPRGFNGPSSSPSYFPPQGASAGPPAPGAQNAPPANPNSAWNTVPQRQTSNALGTDPFMAGVTKAQVAKHTELSDQYGREADLADQKQQYNAQALKMLPNAEVGPMSEWLTTNRSRLLEMGVPASIIPTAGSVTPTLELNKYLKNAALQGARSIYGARMTQTEVKLQTDEMSPSAHMTANAIASLIQQDNIRNAYAKQRGQDYQTYVGRNGDPLSFERWYANKRPLTQFAKEYTADPRALAMLKAQPDTAPQFKQKYGFLPFE